jgi:hypothetical protein
MIQKDNMTIKPSKLRINTSSVMTSSLSGIGISVGFDRDDIPEKEKPLIFVDRPHFGVDG